MGLIAGGLNLDSARAQSNVNVLTYHNDNARTGQNLNETILTPAKVNAGGFGRLFDCPVDGFVYAQPLYLSGVAIPNQGTHNVVYVATEHDTVYAFDADDNQGTNAAPLWQRRLANPKVGETTVPISDFGLNDPQELGITGTPVIDPSSGTLYVVAKIKNTGVVPPTYAERLFALNVATGEIKLGGPVDIQASVPGIGDGADSFGNLRFDPFYEFQRPGLLLVNGIVYIAFASQGDVTPYHGWVIGYDARTLKQVGVYNDTPNGSDGGIWMSGAAPAADSDGNIFLMTGNGTFDGDTGGKDFGDSFLKLAMSGSSLVLTDWFTPYNQAWMDSIDGDLGSGAPLLLPGSVGSRAHPHLLVGCGKQGTIYLLDRDHLGGYNASNDNQIVQYLIPGTAQGTWSMAAYFNGAVYYLGFDDVLKAFRISNGLLSTNPISASTVRFGYPGATPSISADGTNNAIVWVIQADAFDEGGGAVLHAYNATNLADKLYDSSQAGTRDHLALAQKFSVPTVANGKVYVGTGGALSIFGTLTSPGITESPLDQTVVSGTNVTFTVGAVGTPPLLYQWQLNGTNLLGGESASLTLTNVTPSDSGAYTVVVANSSGYVLSDAALLTVIPLPVLRFDLRAGPILQGVVGQNYLIQYADFLEPAAEWLALTTLNLTNTTESYFDAGATNQPQRFYRAVWLPF